MKVRKEKEVMKREEERERKVKRGDWTENEEKCGKEHEKEEGQHLLYHVSAYRDQ